MNYHNITTEDMLNGPGLRTVLWVAGCEHHCKNCHNPETWDKESGVYFGAEDKAELFEKLGKDFIEGITFSGGDPLATYNRRKVTNLAKEIRETFGDSKTIWLYSGYTYEDIKHLKIMEYLNVLVDGKFIEELKDTDLHWRGSSNQRIIDVKKTRESNNIVLFDKN